jgi:hypothetical protein
LKKLMVAVAAIAVSLVTAEAARAQVSCLGEIASERRLP